jgi:hypothetical protein
LDWFVFGAQVQVDLPDQKGRLEILKVRTGRLRQVAGVLERVQGWNQGCSQAVTVAWLSGAAA